MSLKDLIGADKWKQLQKKHPVLEELLYHVVCETCGKTFFEKKLGEVQAMMLKGEWDPYQPQLWFVDAGRHWIRSKFHSIRVYIDDGKGDKTLVKDLSSEWTAGQKSHGFTDAALENELKDLETRIKSRRKS